MPTSVVLSPHDLVRLDVTVPAPAGVGPWNHADEWGNYHEVDALEGNIRYRRSDLSLPPFDVGVNITTTGKDSEPRVCVDWRGRVHVVFTREDPASTFNVLHAISTGDDGATWGTPVTMFAGGKHPTVAVDPDTGTIFFGAYVDGTLKGALQEPGDASPGVEFTLSTASGPISVEDDTWHVQWAKEGPARLLMVCRKLGGSSVSRFAGADDGRTYVEI